jgi:hypothetical protein
MDFCSINTTNHLIIPMGYNRVKRCVHRLARVHSARTQAEIHAIALGFPSNILYIPKLYDVADSWYETEFIIHETNNLLTHNAFHKYPKLFVELFRFKDYMMKEGYFLRGIKLCRLTEEQWALFDFSRFGIVNKNRVKFPKDKLTYSFDQAEWAYGLKYGKAAELREDPYDGLYD